MRSPHDRLTGEGRVMRLLDRVPTKRVDAAAFRDIDPDLETFISVETPEKYSDAVARLTAQDLKTFRTSPSARRSPGA